MEEDFKEEKQLLDSVLIKKVANGYLLYEDEHEYGRRGMGSMEIIERRVFETKESLFEFLQHNF